MPSKLKLQIHMSLDGYMSGPNNSMDWLLAVEWDPAMKDYVSNTIMSSVEHILLGRNLASGFIPAWRSRPADAEGVQFMNTCPKTILSKSLTQESSPWAGEEGIKVVSGELEDEVKQLKECEGKGDVITYGGVQLLQSLLAAGLVDELFLIVEPVSLGDGGKVFTKRMNYELVEAKGFECGHVILHYRSK